MITDGGEKWHYLAIKPFGDFYYLNCFRSFSTENKLKEHKNVCKNHDYC